MTLRRTLSVAVLTVTGLVLAVAPAQAGPGDAVAEGWAGAVTIGDVTVEPIAPCSTEGELAGHSGEVSVPNVVTYASGDSTCTIDEAGEIATATVTGGRFRFDALRQYGGPRIRLTGYGAKCATTAAGSNSSIQFSGLSGVTVPAQLPSNHVVTVPGGPDGKPKATVTFNEVVLPSPADGSLTVHLMHIRMFPQGGPISGDAYVGTVHCAPVP
ncbi:hypothetical protein [Actinophytocola sp. NPDC049390]|uniref:hypothetical protein n=1 Tax=Actinophytocola sp. NPDC049390 TaxID=3363894 RepID=UPI0037B6B09A